MRCSLEDAKSRSLKAKLRRKNWLLHVASSNFHQGCHLVVSELCFLCKLSKHSSVSLKNKDNISLNLCGMHRCRRPSRIKRFGPINSSSPPKYKAKWLLASLFNAKTHFATDSNWNDEPIGLPFCAIWSFVWVSVMQIRAVLYSYLLQKWGYGLKVHKVIGTTKITLDDILN